MPCGVYYDFLFCVQSGNSRVFICDTLLSFSIVFTSVMYCCFVNKDGFLNHLVCLKICCYFCIENKV